MHSINKRPNTRGALPVIAVLLLLVFLTGKSGAGQWPDLPEAPVSSHWGEEGRALPFPTGLHPRYRGGPGQVTAVASRQLPNPAGQPVGAVAIPPVVTVGAAYPGQRGTEFRVAVTLDQSPGMAAGELELTFDPGVLSVQGVERGELLEGFMLVKNLELASQGRLIFTWADALGNRRDGTLLEITFRLRQGDGETGVAISRLYLYDQGLNQVDAVKIDGRVSPFGGLDMEAEGAYPPQKGWNVIFSSAAYPPSVNSQTVYVTGAGGEKVPVSLSLGDGGRRVLVEPEEAYPPGEYQLVVTCQVRTARGRPLQQAVRKSFTVE